INELTSEIIMLSKLNVMDNSFFELVKVTSDLREYCLDRIRYSKLDNATFESKVQLECKIKCDCSMAP
ncbi:two-component sensor histidine kinase, partial [Vibrio breoganii]